MAARIPPCTVPIGLACVASASTILAMAVSRSRVDVVEPHYSRTCMSTVEIRAERAADVDAVRAVHAEAFGRPDEAVLVERLRERARPYLALVAVEGEDVVGHVVFAPVTLHCYQAPYTITALAPLAVRPAWQRREIGSALVGDGPAARPAAGRQR